MVSITFGLFCISGFLHAGPPSPPSNFLVINYTFQAQYFSILLSWESHYGVSMVSYRVSINTSTPQEISTNLTNVTLEGEYNTPLEVQLFAMNCAGNSTEVALIVYQGMVRVATLVGDHLMEGAW